MLALPPRQVTKGLLDGEKPYETPEYTDVLRGLCSGHTLTCSHCGYRVEVSDFPEFLASLAKDNEGGAEEKSALALPSAAEGYGFFRACPRGPKFTFDRANLELVCLPCFHAANTFLPAVEAKGSFGLIPVLDQTEVILIWRYLSLATRCDRAGAGMMQGAIDTMRSTAITDLHKALGLNTGISTISNLDLSYWWATAPAGVAKVAATFLPDLKFLPSHEWDAYGLHLDYALFKNMLRTEEIAEMVQSLNRQSGETAAA